MPTKHDPNQEAELARVMDRVGQHVIDFFNQMGPGYEFNLHEITLYVMQKVKCSPTSPYRIMADLRKKNQVNYVCLSRKESSYRIMPPVEEYDWDGNHKFDTEEL